MAPGLGLPPCIVYPLAHGPHAPSDDLGVQRFADRTDVAQFDRSWSLMISSPPLISILQRGRCCVPDSDAVVLQDAVPSLGSNLPSYDTMDVPRYHGP